MKEEMMIRAIFRYYCGNFRIGRTYIMAKLAKLISSEETLPIIILVRSQQQAEEIQKEYKLDPKKVKFITWSTSIEKELCGINRPLFIDNFAMLDILADCQNIINAKNNMVASVMVKYRNLAEKKHENIKKYPNIPEFNRGKLMGEEGMLENMVESLEKILEI